MRPFQYRYITNKHQRIAKRAGKIVKCSDWNSSRQLQPNFPTKQFKMKMNEKLLMGYGKETIHGSSVGHFNGPALSLRGQ